MNAQDHKASEPGSIRSGKAHFRPRARLLRTLGYELITNEIIAIQELVKNSYDADASEVTITLEDPRTAGKGTIVVADNGVGMTLDVLLGAWMEPATVSKVKAQFSSGGRRVSGEKGIGRFASARVATTLELTSVSAVSGRRIRARFDWGHFDQEDSYLDQVECDWSEDDAGSDPPGTELRLIGLRDDWETANGDRLVRLRSQLSRLVSPVAPPSDFRIELVLPDRFVEHAGLITPPAFLGKPRYWIVGRMESDGRLEAVYEGPDGMLEILENDGSHPVVTINNQRPRCGEFDFQFRVWDRAPEDLRALATEFGSTLRAIRSDLDAASGISIYRDGFRVLLPEDSDWLGLDSRRVQNPTLRLSNNQVVGVVSISRDVNSGLIDQTNRQGVVDSPEYDDFRSAVREVLSKLEARRDLVRRKPQKDSEMPGGIFGRISIAPIRDYAASHYTHDATLRKVIEETDASINRSITEVKNVLVRYRRLATLGQLVDGILHEGRTPLGAILNAVRFLEKDLKKHPAGSILTKAIRDGLFKRLDTLSTQAVVIGELFTRIAPFSGRQRGRPRETTMERVLAGVVGLLRDEIDAVGATVDLPEGTTKVTVDEADMQGIFRNLIENALYWVGKAPAESRLVKIELFALPGELSVVVSDSGPGVAEEIRDRIMVPYFSMRPEGQGLGLALAGELAAEYDGALELLADGPLDGATFRVVLRRRVG